MKRTIDKDDGGESSAKRQVLVPQDSDGYVVVNTDLSTATIYSQASQHHPTFSASSDPGVSLWRRTYESTDLPITDKLDPATTANAVSNQLLIAAQKYTHEYRAKKWKFMTEKRSVWREEEGGYVDEEEFIFLGDAMRRVGTGVGKMGEVISVLGRENKVLDQYVLLPWQMILSILETEGDKRELIGVSITSIVEIIQMITECTIYERLYLGRSPRLVGHWRIEKVIVKLYGRVLTFLEQVGRMNKDRDGACKEVRELRKGCDKAMRKLREKIKLLVPQDEIQDDIDASLKSILRDLHNPIGRNNIKDSELCDDLDVESQTEILQWISKTDYQNHHIHAMKDLLPHTGTWLNDAPEFKEWRVASGSRILWLHGIPGAGKTKLACNTIQKLRGKNEHVGFFYCNKNESLRRDKTTILQTLLEQLSAPITEVQDDDQPTGLKKQRKVFKSIDNLYTIHRKIQRTASLNFAECRDLLTSIAGMYEQVTIIIDALDEAEFESRGHLLDALAEIMKDSQGIVKIFISSRDDQDIKQSLKGVPNYYIKPKDNQDDIKRFIERELERAEGKEKGNGGWCVALDQALKEVVLDGLLRKADGMFQWVTLQLEYLKNLTTVEAIQEELLAIKAPKDLTAAYEKLLDSILSSSDSTTAIIALRWILCTEIPLRTEEWVAATTHTLCTHDDATEPPEIQLSHILNLCRNLVVEDTEGKVVRFSHLSVREHLEEYRSELFAPSLCHSMAAESCLRLILYDYKLESFHTTFLAFHDYATVYWSYHAVKCDSVYKHSEIEILLQEILGQSAKSLEAYQLWFKSVRDRFRRHRHSSWWDRGLGFDLLYHGSLISSPPNSLFLIANLGLGEQFPLLLNWNLKDINCNNENKETYLFLASREGHLATVKSLLKSGANVNAGRTCGFFWHPYHKFPNPLFAAIAKGRREVMEILLDHNADICHNASNYGWMEIKDLVQVAAKIGNAEIFRVVIDRLNPVSLSKTVVELVVSRFGMPLVEYVIGIYPEMVISQSVVDAATRNSNGDVLRLCLDRARTVQPTTKLTDESILAALAVECYQDDKQAKTAIKNVLDQWIGGGDVTEEMLSLAARNTAYGPMFLAQLFDRSPDLVATEALILDIVCKHIGLQLSLYDSKSCPGESMLCLLQRMPEITDAVFFAILHTDHVKDAAIWELLLKNPPTISHEILLAAASNKDIDPRFMQRLLEANPAVTEDVLVAALKHQEIIDNFALLLEKNPVITEALVVASLKKGCSVSFFIFLWGKYPLDAFQSENVVNAILKKLDSFSCDQIDEILPQILSKTTTICQETFLECIRKVSYLPTLELIIEKYPAITEQELIFAATNRKDGAIHCGTLLHLLEINPNVTEGVMIAAAGTRGSIIDRILGAHSHPIVTGRIITILVSGYSKYSAYKYDENDLISTTKTLLSKSPIHTETVVLDIIGTARNSASLQAMKALEPEISLDINPSMALVSLLKWDQGFSHEFLKWHREKFPEYIAPEMIYHTAAGYGDCVDYLRFIIDLNPSKSSMIENIILMLRGDLLPGPETLRFAFTKLKTGEPTTKITSGMLAAVARKVRSESDLQILLDATSRLPADIITHKVLEAAAENESGCAIHLLRVLLQLADNLSLTKDIARNVIQSEINLVLSNYSDTEKESKRKDAREELSSLFHNFQEFPAIYKIAGTLSDFNSQYIILPETKVQAIIYTLITDKELEGSIAKPGLLHDFGMTQYTALKTFLDKDPETPITEKVVRAARRLLNPYSFELIRKRDPYLPLNERIIFSSLQKISSLTKRKTALADHLSKDGSEADFLFQSERFFVEAVKSWGYKEPYIKRFFFNGDGSVRQGIITEDVLLAAAGSDRVKEKDLLAFLDQVRPMTKSTEFLVAITDRMKRPNDILSNAIEFLRNRGEDVLTEGFLESYSKELSSASDSDGSELVYSFGPWIDSINPTIITESVMACAADNTSQGLQLLEKFIEINPNAPITANVLVKAVASLEYHGWPNASHHGKVLRYLLKVVEERGARTEEIVQELITEKVLLAVAGSGSDTAENELMLKYLLKTYPETPVTGKLFLKAVRKGLTSDTLRYLLDKIQEPISDGTLEKCLLAVVRTKDTKALGIILDQAPQISISSIISEKVLISAAKRADDVHLMDLLLSKYPGELITEPVFLAAAQNDDPSILQYLLYKLPSTRITSAILVAGAKNMTWRTIKTLLSFQPGPSQISGDVLIAAAQSENPYIIESILKSGLVEVNAITESVLLAAANNQWAGGSVMETLLKWTFEQSRPSRITSSVMVSAAKSSNRAMMEVLLAKNPVVEEEVFIAAAGNFSERNMLLLLAKCPDMVITENILVVAVGNVNYYVTKHLLSLQSSRLDSSIITENVLVTAARNSRVKVLLWMFIERAERDGRKLDIRENVLREVARNRFTGAEIILEELLEHSNTGLLTTTTITISLLEAAASNSSPRGEAIYKFLLSKSSAPALKIPDVAMKKILLSAAKTGNWRTLRYLLTQNIHFMTDTGFLQELIISAAGGAESENLGYLMSVYDDSLPVLKEMVDAARGNTDKKVGQRMVRWLTERDGALRCYITQPEKEQANDIDEDGEDWDDEQEKKEMKLEMEKEKKRESEEEVVGY